MKVLISGGAGFIGSHTARRLLAGGHDVRVLDALVPPVHADHTIPQELLDLGTEWIDGDVRDRATWERALDEVDAVYHLAAYQDHLPEFSRFLTTNAVSTALLYEVLVSSGRRPHRVVVASSQAVYGEGAYTCPRCPEAGRVRPGARSRQDLERGRWDPVCPSCDGPLEPGWLGESDRPLPHNPYAISKYAQETTALALGERYEIPTVALRYSIVQGAGQSFRNAYSGVLRIFAQRVLHGLPPVCYEDGGQLRDYVSVHDVAAANEQALSDDRFIGRAFNVGGGREVSVRDYAAIVCACAGMDSVCEIPGIYRFGDTRHTLSGIDELSALGWAPEVSLTEITNEYLAWAGGMPGFTDHTEAADAHMRAVGTLRSVRP